MSDTGVTPTRGESLFLWRRRAGLNQVQAAETFETNVDTYREWEADQREAGQPRKHLGELKTHEVCVLLRRRAKKTQRQLAIELSCTRLWIIQMENGEAPIDRLREYWRL